ncbi:MAG: hypothetical protein K8F52_03710 [Candidatus Scalindua rubra]|uniref:Putative proetein n=1 Tax=Candidatus Scalindua brodae TaxID=237368 RepID=A0A0B0EKE3_9BACT|nr:MAG: putative proetein [Candidatus Scalindua brodae]MBZ0107753.1 hypothetical protein [Candidatus Scalindua rubra]
MDISDIKKNKFWISIGGGLVFVIAFYFCVVSPFQSRKTEEMESLERLLTRLERYETKGHMIRNEKWIKAEEAKLEAIKNIQQEYELFYKERDRHLEKIFESANGEEIKDEALWENRYIQGSNVLLGRIKNRELPLGENALSLKQWKVKIPTWEEILPEQKRFWITEELVKIILKDELKVVYLEGINFEMENAVSTNVYTELYDIIPFTITVSMNAESLLFLMNELLKSKLSFEIKTVNISGELNRFRVTKEAEKSSRFGQPVQKRSSRFPSIVDVVIDAYVLDFKT